jgi:hypothetical protein
LNCPVQFVRAGHPVVVTVASVIVQSNEKSLMAMSVYPSGGRKRRKKRHQ